MSMELYDSYSIPEYAVCPIENGADAYAGLLDEDIQNIHNFFDKIKADCPKGYSLEWEDLKNPFFSCNPAFGLPTTCVTLNVYKIL